jgi:hypothetical protein
MLEVMVVTGECWDEADNTREGNCVNVRQRNTQAVTAKADTRTSTESVTFIRDVVTSA